MENPNDANSRINAIWERLGLGLLSFIVACLFVFYQGISGDMKDMQTTIVQLQTTKVSREDLRDVEQRLNNKIEALGSQLAGNSAANKADILARMDLYFSNIKNKK